LPAALKIHPSGILKVNLSNGKSIRLATNQTCHVTNVLFWDGSSQYEYTEIFLHLFPKIKTFFDVGANIGYLSIMAGKTNPDIVTYSFDPSPGPYFYLTENIRINGLNKVFPFQMALSDSNGEFSFHIAVSPKYKYLKYNSLGGSGHLSHVRENPTKHQVKVKAQTLDDFISENQINGLDLLKLDVEEAEHLVLAGGHASILKFRPIVVCEVFSSTMLQQVRQEIMIHGFRAFRFTEGNLKEEKISPDSEVKPD
jgi:FkbM family methyltransferase